MPAFTPLKQIYTALRRRSTPLALALLLAGCSAQSNDPPGNTTPDRGSGGSTGSSNGGTGGTGASTGGSSGTATGGAGPIDPGSGGSGGAGSGGAGTGGAGETGSGGSMDAAASGGATGEMDAAGGGGPPAAGGKVLFIGGASPMIGTDLQIHNALKARMLDVQDVRETALPADATGARLIVMSYSMSSAAFKAEPWADVPVPIVVLEHNLLPGLGMSQEHGYQFGVTLTITSMDAGLSAGLPMGDLGVYTAQGKEMFWGVPGPESIKIASMKGSPGHVVFFAYPSGAMMVGRKAPAKRMLFFAASHAPPAVKDEILNPDGQKLLGAAIDWLIK